MMTFGWDCEPTRKLNPGRVWPRIALATPVAVALDPFPIVLEVGLAADQRLMEIFFFRAELADL